MVPFHKKSKYILKKMLQCTYNSSNNYRQAGNVYASGSIFLIFFGRESSIFLIQNFLIQN